MRSSARLATVDNHHNNSPFFHAQPCFRAAHYIWSRDQADCARLNAGPPTASFPFPSVRPVRCLLHHSAVRACVRSAAFFLRCWFARQAHRDGGGKRRRRFDAEGNEAVGAPEVTGHNGLELAIKYDVLLQKKIECRRRGCYRGGRLRGGLCTASHR